MDGKDSSGAHHGTGDVETDTDGLATLEEEDEEDETKQNGTACAHDRSNSTYPSSASSSSTSTASTAPAAAVANTQSVNVEIHLHIVFSATYRVPQLMFQAVDMSEFLGRSLIPGENEILEKVREKALFEMEKDTKSPTEG